MGCLPSAGIADESQAAVAVGAPEGNAPRFQGVCHPDVGKAEAIAESQRGESEFRAHFIEQPFGMTFAAAVVGQFQQIDGMGQGLCEKLLNPRFLQVAGQKGAIVAIPNEQNEGGIVEIVRVLLRSKNPQRSLVPFPLQAPARRLYDDRDPALGQAGAQGIVQLFGRLRRPEFIDGKGFQYPRQPLAVVGVVVGENDRLEAAYPEATEGRCEQTTADIETGVMKAAAVDEEMPSAIQSQQGGIPLADAEGRDSQRRRISFRCDKK